MDCIKNKVKCEMEKGWIGPNKECPYHPSHFKGQDCTFCYCPFYPCNDEDLGCDIKSRNDKDIWCCTDCLFIHRTEVCKFILEEMKRLNITEPTDPRIKDILPEAKKRFLKKGKAIMVMGATSDAGKSVINMALCRSLNRRGFIVIPFKSQNMSLNSKVTRGGHEVAMIQELQCQAAGVTTMDYHVNPILLKPKGDCTSQVIVEGKPFGDYDVKSYYADFVPGPGKDIVRRNVDFLKSRYDFVVMEGAGSPAEINIYDKDIANMRAAEIADAACILVVNVEWGGAFAYALGTIELIPEEDRKRIKGVILNNVRGNPENMKDGAKKLEELTGIPVLGIVPHVNVRLPTEDSEAFREATVIGNGKMKIAVVRFPRIANFTDLDPLFFEDTTVSFVNSPEGLENCDAIVLPGTKNTLDDLRWMKTSGMFDAVLSKKGKIPILGICGGYQMMGRELNDIKGLEGKEPSKEEGLGFFDMITSWDSYDKITRRVISTHLDTDSEVEGYEIHMGTSESKEKSLVKPTKFFIGSDEGSSKPEEMLFGTYLHGVLDKPGFRRFFLEFSPNGKNMGPNFDYADTLDERIDTMTDAFEKGTDIEAILRIMEEIQ